MQGGCEGVIWRGHVGMDMGKVDVREEPMPIVEHLAITLVEVLVVRDRMLGLQARHAQAFRWVFPGEESVGPPGTVHVALRGHVEDRA